MYSRKDIAGSERTSTATAEEIARREDQVGAVVRLLREHEGEDVPLFKIMEVGGAQYGARIHTARHKLGLKIVNRTKVIDGVRHSWFRLVPTPKSEQATLFGEKISYSDPEEVFG